MYVRRTVVSMCSTLLCRIVPLYRETFGSLPVSDRGKPLQEVLQEMPGISLVGVKPWTIHVTLGGSVPKEPATGRIGCAYMH